jgi:asparagine synthase (glutamine-hydrolysing)
VGRLIRGPESEITCWTEDIAARLSLIGELHDRAPDSWLHEFLLLETETYLANTLLRDSDVTSMAHSLELRVPLVDREIFALAGRLPPNSKLNLRGGKCILREAFHDFLPPWIYADRKKKTFTLPLMKWMRHPAWQSRIRDVLSSEKFRSRGWLDARMTQSLADHYFKSAASGKSVWRMSQTVWMMFVLESWALEHVD